MLWVGLLLYESGVQEVQYSADARCQCDGFDGPHCSIGMVS